MTSAQHSFLKRYIAEVKIRISGRTYYLGKAEALDEMLIDAIHALLSEHDTLREKYDALRAEYDALLLLITPPYESASARLAMTRMRDI
jgi:hypothetical protein